MELSPEEKRKIYEEEKARIEAREQIERERREMPQATSTGLPPRDAGLLCYIGGWITGIIFFIIEQKNRWVRFHAAQSIVVFGTITVAGKPIKHDIVIAPDGKVRKRKKKLSKQVYGTSHTLSLAEAEETWQQGARMLIIGTGHVDRVRLSPEAQAYLEGKGCQVELLPTPKAIERWNEAKGDVIGLFHITC